MMDTETGVSLFSANLKLNINNNDEDDEEEAAELRERDLRLKEQLELLSDISDDDEGHHGSSSEGESNPEGGSRENSGYPSNNGMIFGRLSDIMEHSPSKSGYSEGYDDNEQSPVQNGIVFSSPRSTPSKFHRGNADKRVGSGGRGDGDAQYQPIFKTKTKVKDNEVFQPLFLNGTNMAKNVNNDSANSYRQAALGGRGDTVEYQPIYRTNTSTENSEVFQSNLSVNASNQSLNSNHVIEEAYRQAELGGEDQLRVLYEVRMRELKQLTAQLNEERQLAAKHRQECSRQLLLLQAEKERAQLSLTEASKLLVAGKEDKVELQKEIDTLRENIAALQKDKDKSDKLAEEIQVTSQVQIQDLEQRIALMERCDSTKNLAKRYDIILQELRHEHQQQVVTLQREIDTVTKKLVDKEKKCLELDQKVCQLQRSQETLLVEKAETINQLSSTLAESQDRVKQLMSTNVTADNVRLQTELETAHRDRDLLNQTVKQLQGECEMMRSDLAQYDSVSQLTLPQGNSSSDETDSITQLGIGRKHKTSNLHQADLTGKLKGELHRSLLNGKAKRAEIDRLQQLVQEKESQIQEMTKQERIYLAQKDQMMEQLDRMMAEFMSLQSKKEHDNDARNSDWTEEVASLKAEVAELRKAKAVVESERLEVQRRLEQLTKSFEAEKRREISDYNKEYVKFHDEAVAKVRKEVEEEASLKIKEYSIRLEQSLKEVADVKEMYVSMCKAKEQLTQSLSVAKAQLQQVTEERDRLAAEIDDVKKVRDQLARRLNESALAKADDETRTQLQHVTEERDRLAAEIDDVKKVRNQLAERLSETAGTKGAVETSLQLTTERDRLAAELAESVATRDQLVRRVSTFKRENDELTLEIKKLNLMVNQSSKNPEIKCGECERLREELSAMSARHTLELSTARTELQGARDRVLHLEKCARLQFDTEVKSLRQDRDMLKTKCDEKEVQIKKLIESRKRPPATVNASTQVEEAALAGTGIEERHRREVARCREEYHTTLAAMGQTHHQALMAAVKRHREEMEQLRQAHHQILESVQQQVEQREVSHRRELQAVEERTKQLTVQFFAEEFKKLKGDPATMQALQKTLSERTEQLESVQKKLATVREESGQQLAALQAQLDADRESAAQLMVHWAQELKNTQGELKLKEAIIEDQGSKMERARAEAVRYRNKLIKNNKEITTQYTNKCNEYRTRLLEAVKNSEKEVSEKVKQMEQVYEDREKDLKKQLKKLKQRIT